MYLFPPSSSILLRKLAIRKLFDLMLYIECLFPELWKIFKWPNFLQEVYYYTCNPLLNLFLIDRISKIIKQLVKIGNRNILISCDSFLKSTIKCLKILKEKADEEVQGKQMFSHICLCLNYICPLHSAAESNMRTAAEIAIEQEGIVASITEESTLLKDLQEKSYGQDTAYTVRSNCCFI